MAKVLKSVGRVVKKIVKSKAFKYIAIAALVFVGGAALGMWNAPGMLSGVNGALVGGGQAAGTAATASAATVNTAAGLTTAALPSAAAGTAATTGAALAPGAGVLAAGNGGLALAAPTAGQALASSVIPTAAGGTASTAAGMAGVGTGAGAGTGVISRMMQGAGNMVQSTAKFANKHPFIAGSMVQGVATALSPDEMDILQEKQRLEQVGAAKARKRRDENLNIDAINLGIRPQTGVLRYASNGENVFNGGVLARSRSV